MNCKGYQSTASHLTLLYQNTICTQHHDTSHVSKQVYVFFPCMVRTEKDSRTSCCHTCTRSSDLCKPVCLDSIGFLIIYILSSLKIHPRPETQKTCNILEKWCSDGEQDFLPCKFYHKVANYVPAHWPYHKYKYIALFW